MPAPDTDKPIIEITHDRVREIRLNRAQEHNSLTIEMATALLSALSAAAADQHIRSVLLTAAGKSFCSGGDLREMMAHKDDLPAYVDNAMRTAHNPLIAGIADFPKPVIACVQGPAIGAGVGLALAADITLMSDSASLVLPFVSKLAIVPDAGSSWFLAQALGAKRAMGQLLTGEPIKTSQALEFGLAWQCVANEDLPHTGLKLASQCAQRSGACVVRTRGLLRQASQQDLGAQLAQEHELQKQSFASADALEGITAITQAREPLFKD